MALGEQASMLIEVVRCFSTEEPLDRAVCLHQ